MSNYTIGEVAERTGFTTSALRFYEKHGLVGPVGRTAAGYRLYDDSSLDRLDFVARAKQLGCTLEEITDLADLWDGENCGPVQRRLHELVSDKIAEAQTRTTELVRFTAQLQSAAARLDADPADGPCDDRCACLGEPPADAAEATTEPVPVRLGERVGPDIACTLTADEMPGRMEDWQAVLGAVSHRTALPGGGVRLTFGPDVALEQLARLAAAEQTCCRFFAFAITVDERGVALEVRAPDDADDVVTAVFGAAS